MNKLTLLFVIALLFVSLKATNLKTKNSEYVGCKNKTEEECSSALAAVLSGDWTELKVMVGPTEENKAVVEKFAADNALNVKKDWKMNLLKTNKAIVYTK